MGSDHLPIVISVSIGGSHPSNVNDCTKRPRLTLGKLDKKAFTLLISSCMTEFQLELNSIQLYDKWIDTVLDCFMRAGGLKIGGQGTCHKFDLRKNCMVTFKFSHGKVGKRSLVGPRTYQVLGEASIITI